VAVLSNVAVPVGRSKPCELVSGDSFAGARAVDDGPLQEMNGIGPAEVVEEYQRLKWTIDRICHTPLTKGPVAEYIAPEAAV